MRLPALASRTHRADWAMALAPALALAACVLAPQILFAAGTAVSVGEGQGRLISEDGVAGDCIGQPLLLNSDSTYENGYAWEYGGVREPNYGAFAECYSGTGTVCSVVLDLTQTGSQADKTLDAYVWEDDGGRPGAVLAVQMHVDPGPIAFWPSLSRHEVPISAIVDGPHWVGCWGDWPLGATGWFVGADLDGGAPGCSSTNIAPDSGWPDEGWQNVSIVWAPTHALGIGLRLTDELPGACCAPDGSCELSNVVLCQGEFLGNGVPCDPNPCTQPPLGACCLPDLSCVVQSEYECDMDLGFYFGDDSGCETISCFQPCPPLVSQPWDAGEPGRGPNANGILFLHSDPSIVYSEGTDYCDASDATCETATARVDTPGPVVFHAIAQFPSEASPRLSGITFGINYADCFVLLDSGHCADFELPNSEWPASGEGTALVWNQARTSSTTEVYWFAGYVIEDQATVFELIPHPIQGAEFADDSIPSQLDPIRALGKLGFFTAGDLPCFGDTTGACCFDDGSCAILNEADCSSSGGDYVGDESTCVPSPCSVVPTVERSWGQIKGLFR